MRIDGTYRPATSTRTTGRGTTDARFTLEGEAGAQPPAATAQAAPSSSIDSLIALQSVEDPLLAKKKAVRRGRSLLDTLDAIKADLLAGAVAEGRLNQLLALVTQAREGGDPKLDALLDDIELRALVELAKFGRF